MQLEWWVWVIIGIAVVLAILLAALVIQRRRRAGGVVVLGGEADRGSTRHEDSP